MEGVQFQLGQHSSVDFTAHTASPLIVHTSVIADFISCNLLAHSPNAKRVSETVCMIVSLLFFTFFDSKIPQNQPDRQRFVYESVRGETTHTLHAYVSPDETGVRLCSAPEKQTGAQAAQLLP